MALLVAVVGDGNTTYQLHDEIRSARACRSGVKHLGDIRMIHQRQCLTFGFEAGDHVASVHAWPNHLQSHLALHRLVLLGDKHETEASLANLLHELVWSDDSARPFRRWAVE